MCNVRQKAEDVKWVFTQSEFTYVLATCGLWEAQLATEVYPKGQVMIVPAEGQEKKVPCFLGDKRNRIPQPDNLIRLIEEVSNAMVGKLKCEMVYLASLNESRNGMHFWLIPRYKEHKDLLGIDGFPLMSELRNDFVRRKICSTWDMPPDPSGTEKKEIKNRWKVYAEEYKKKVQTGGWVSAVGCAGHTILVRGRWLCLIIGGLMSREGCSFLLW